MAERNDLIIRTATVSDARDIARVGLSLGYDSSPPVSVLSAIIDDPTQTLVVASVGDGPVIGWIHAAYEMRAASAPFVEILGLAVDADSQRRGVASALVASAGEWAHSIKGVRRLRVRVNPVREGGLAFYEAAGFTEKKRQIVLERDVHD
jgi:GNAT superfamily N-acetyltransferase